MDWAGYNKKWLLEDNGVMALGRLELRRAMAKPIASYTAWTRRTLGADSEFHMGGATVRR